ncbi:MAG: hypothetical protein JOZ41_01675, partial [Chloroflexi bacterium]|nr:hypothetical protein [Chloroflexota bacterium]
MSLQAYPLRKTLLALCGLALLAFSFAPSGAAARSRTQAQAPVADVQVSNDTFPA